MPNVFISYSRESSAAAEALATDIRALGHVVWFDQELTGGQAWWDQILAMIRKCDVLVFLITPQSVSSTACMREYGYAAALRRAILPILIADGVRTNLLQPALAQIQFIDYRHQDRSAALRLARALATVSSPGPLPDPLPESPEAPISYLGGLAEQIETRSTLSYEQQSALVVDLKKGLRDPETLNDARSLLDRLRRRRDLMATIAEEIDELLEGVTNVSTAATVADRATAASAKHLDERPSDETQGRTTERQETQRSASSEVGTSSDGTPTWRERFVCAMRGAVLGTLLGASAIGLGGDSEMMVVGFVTGAGAAVAGAISGRRKQIINLAIVGAAVVTIGFLAWWFLASAHGSLPDLIAVCVILFAPVGAILGAIAGVILRKFRAPSTLK